MNLNPESLNQLSQRVIAACIEVHRELGPGLLESAYEVCLARELAMAEIPFRRQVPVPVIYKGEVLEAGYRIDLLVDERLIVELKAARSSAALVRAQVLTYLKLLRLPLGLGVNFNHISTNRRIDPGREWPPRVPLKSLCALCDLCGSFHSG